MRKSVGLGAALLAMTAATSTFAAQNGCVPNPDSVTSERAIQFLGNPEALLDKFKDGQGGLASQVRDMLTNRPETLEGMGSLAKASSDDQGRAIGAGMGTAAAVCVLTQPQFAQQIQDAALKVRKARADPVLHEHHRRHPDRGHHGRGRQWRYDRRWRTGD